MEYMIQTNGITKRYGKHKVLDNVSMHVPKGSIYGFVGKNGAGEKVEIPLNSAASMNMWGFTPEFLDELQTGFAEFLKTEVNNLKAEYLLPDVVGKMVKEGKASVKVLPTHDRWFGVTYKEDKDTVVKSLQELIDKGEYPNSLY